MSQCDTVIPTVLYNMRSPSSSPSDSIKPPRRKARKDNGSTTLKSGTALDPISDAVAGGRATSSSYPVSTHHSSSSNKNTSNNSLPLPVRSSQRSFGRSLSSNAVVAPSQAGALRDRKISAMFAPVSSSQEQKASNWDGGSVGTRRKISRGPPPPSSSREREKQSQAEPIVLDDLDEIEDTADDDGIGSKNRAISSVPLRPTRRQHSVPVTTTTSTVAPSSTQLTQRDSSGLKKPAFLSSRMFKAPLISKPSPALVTKQSGDVPWTDLFRPRNLDELAVHKKKVDDVRTWLNGVINHGDRKRLLVLRGPSGSGKTATMELLAQELGIRLIEWKTPGVDARGEGFVSTTGKLDEFLSSASRYGSLTMSTKASAAVSTGSAPPSELREAIMMEEFLFSSNIISSFRTVILSFLGANTVSLDDLYHGRVKANARVTPLVMCISETNLSTASSSHDNNNFTAHKLLGPDILTHQSTTVIDFNPIASTYMQKALDLVLKREASVSGRKSIPGAGVLYQLSQIGDIRSAVSSLQFICLNPDPAAFTGRIEAKSNKRKRGAKAEPVPMTAAEKRSLQTTSLRESTLGIFHAVGKVIHNSRESEPCTDPDQVPPPNPLFPTRHRPCLPDIGPDSLMAELGTDLQTFVAAVQENYVLSCGNQFDPEASTECMFACIDDLSIADMMAPSSSSSGSLSGRAGRAGRVGRMGSAVDELRQDEISFNVAVRGVMFALPSPVEWAGPPPVLAASVMAIRTGNTGPSANQVSLPSSSSIPAGGLSRMSAYKIFYPTSLRIWRLVDEVDGLAGSLIDRIAAGRFCPGSKSSAWQPMRSALQSVVPHHQVNMSQHLPSSSQSSLYQTAQKPAHTRKASAAVTTLDNPFDPTPMSRPSSRSDALLDIFPFSSIIRTAHLKSFPPDHRSRDKLAVELSRLTNVSAPPVPVVVPTRGWIVDELNDGIGFEQKYGGPDFSGAERHDGGALVLSDDDIED